MYTSDCYVSPAQMQSTGDRSPPLRYKPCSKSWHDMQVGQSIPSLGLASLCSQEQRIASLCSASLCLQETCLLAPRGGFAIALCRGPPLRDALDSVSAAAGRLRLSRKGQAPGTMPPVAPSCRIPAGKSDSRVGRFAGGRRPAPRDPRPRAK